jgi:uncharacterized protein (TIGR03435 family)
MGKCLTRATTILSIFAWFSFASPQAAQSPLPEFEAASVKPAPSGPASFSGGPGSSSPERVTWESTSLLDLIQAAYRVESYQISGPAWIATERYSVTAKLPKGSTDTQLAQMLASLLAERFGLTFHRAAKQFPGYEIALAPGRRPNLIPSPAKADDEPKFRGDPTIDGMVHYTFTQTTMESLANRVSMMIPRRGQGRGIQILPVNDRTGLSGKFDFHLDVAQPTSITIGSNDIEDNAGSISDALQHQLGLKLNHVKIELETLVIDHVERVPTAN